MTKKEILERLAEDGMCGGISCSNCRNLFNEDCPKTWGTIKYAKEELAKIPKSKLEIAQEKWEQYQSQDTDNKLTAWEVIEACRNAINELIQKNEEELNGTE